MTAAHYYLKPGLSRGRDGGESWAAQGQLSECTRHGFGLAAEALCASMTSRAKWGR